MAFLAQQGYARLADLLAHVVAWWDDGMLNIDKMLSDLDYQSPKYDVDSFNAQAIERARTLDEPTVIGAMEHARQAWLDLIARLPTQALQDKRIAKQLYIEIIGHWREHEIT